MYLLNPLIWYLKSTINNLKVLHHATRMHDQQKLREQPPTSSDDQDVYKLPVQVPILVLVCDNYEKNDGTTLKNVYVESHLQLNFHTVHLKKDNYKQINVKQDNRFVFLCAYENTEAFFSVELQIFFSSAERRIA
ncbi:unnamed protein product, partial [Rotaria socialis]